MKVSPVPWVTQDRLETDYEKLPAGHYWGRGTRQERTGPNGPFLEGAPSRYLLRPEHDREDVARPRGPRGYARSDERVFEDVCERLAEDHDLDASEIEVGVDDGIVTLGGWVDSREAREWAEDLTWDVLGVGDVKNHLHVRPRP